MDEKHKGAQQDLDWYLKLLNSLCGESEDWVHVNRCQQSHRCEFGHSIPRGSSYFRREFGPDRRTDSKLCEACGIRFLNLLFGGGGGITELAVRRVREQYGSLLVALRKLDDRRTNDRTPQGEAGQSRAVRPTRDMSSGPRWSAERLAEVRERYPCAYKKWTEVEESRLDHLVRTGASAKQIALELQRQPSAIRSRLNKLGLLSGGVNSTA